MNGSNAVAGNYFFCNSYNQIYYINSVSWNEFSEVIRAESRPNAEKRYAGKYYFVPNYIYYIYATTPEVLSWEQLKTDVDLRNLKTEIEYLLSGRLEVVEYSYQQPEACEEALGKLYMWKQYGEYKICVPGDTVVATIASVTQEESSGSTGSDDGELSIFCLSEVITNNTWKEHMQTDLKQDMDVIVIMRLTKISIISQWHQQVVI